jgi:hypothetical protein
LARKILTELQRMRGYIGLTPGLVSEWWYPLSTKQRTTYYRVYTKNKCYGK